ncbi:MAG: hypothetical protein EHM25_10475 [Nitrosopumilales archaeon]|nr:MAG: hypothetical protein EHM25_10475 [Nitrosopumilales archaeon]
MKPKINRENISYHLLEYQLNMIGKSLVEAADEEDWYYNWYISAEKHKEFKIYAIRLIKKVFKCNTSKAEAAFNWFDFGVGLKVRL